MASPQASSILAGADRVATRGNPQTRASTVLIGVGVLAVCLAAPATLVSAQSPAPAADADAGQAVAPPEPSQAPQPQPPDAPPPPTTSPSGPVATPPPAPSAPGEATPPPPLPVASSSTSARAAGSATVSATDNPAGENFFAPLSITIQVGATVTWSNDGQVTHTVTANGGSFDSGNLNPGQSFSHTFTQAGTFPYYCQPHRFVGMKGTVTVQAAGSGGGGGTSNSGTSPTTTTPTGPGSESAAGASPDAAGTGTQLPSTGMPLVPPLAAGVGLLLAGALLRRRARVS